MNNLLERLCCISRSDEALEIRRRLGRPLNEEELLVLLFAEQIEEWALSAAKRIKEVM